VTTYAYARTADGTHVAHQVRGDGRPLLLISDGFVPIEVMDEERSFRACLDRLSSFSRLITFDRRGIGMSDPPPDAGTLRLQDWVDDAVAVLDAVEAEQALVMASAENCVIALLLAALHPQRLSGLVLVHPSARGLVAPDYPIGYSPEVIEAVVCATTEPGDDSIGAGVLALTAPSVADDPEFHAWWQRAGRRGASPAVAQRLLRLVYTADVRWTLPRVKAPVLVLYREGDQAMPRSHSEYVAQHVPEGRFRLLPGADDLWWVGQTAPLLDAVEEFARELADPPKPRRRPATPRTTSQRQTPEALGAEVVAALFRRREAVRALQDLTDRERAVLELMARGYSNAAVCEELYLSPKTVETHIAAIFTKLGLERSDDVNRRVAAVLRLLGAT
jgi:pimeloyl-ACP methyl ester carboxylesterase/DNA-binding CsgD family transcriptional regulator